MNIQSIKNFFQYKGILSRAGFLLFFIAFFLTGISFLKGIQILIFIPSFVLAVFLYSWFDLYGVDKNFSFHLFKEKERYFLKLYLKKNKKYNFILAHQEPNGTIEFLSPNKNIGYELEEQKKYHFILYVFGRFNIFRKKIDIGKIQSKENNQTHHYFSSNKYVLGNTLSKIDTYRTSLHFFPYTKKEESISHQIGDSHTLKIISNQDIFVEKSKYILHSHLFLILIGIVGLFIEWQDITFNIIIILTVLGVFFAKKKKLIIHERYKNIFILTCFLLMLVLTFIKGDMSGSGSMFLLQILCILYLFPKSFLNSFLFIFLSLFVFVAISLFANQIRFIFLFLGYIFTSIYLLFYISGNESFDFREYKFGTIDTPIHLMKTFVLVIIGFFLFYFILPHGNKTEETGSFGTNNSDTTTSGFNEEINLEKVQKIYENDRKVFVIENIKKDDVRDFQIQYFRGMRYQYFNGKKWLPGENKNIIPFENQIFHGKTQSMKIKYYFDGNKNIFVPYAPIMIRISSNVYFYRFNDDPTILSIGYALNEPLSIDFDFAVSKKGQLQDTGIVYSGFTLKENKTVDKIFDSFIKSIPKSYQNDPKQLMNYIKYNAGFEYSIDDIAFDIQDFLYGKKQGHCEYFATTLAVVLQKLGYQATLVNGYANGEYNNLASSYILRAKNAHSWVEVYNEDLKKWEIFDATPGGGFDDGEVGFMKQIVNIYDYMDIKWYTYIVGYTGQEQLKWIHYFGENYKQIFFGILLVFLFLLLYFVSYFFYWFIFIMNKRERLMYILSIFSKKSINVLCIVEKNDPDFAQKLKNYIYGENGNITFGQLFCYIVKSKNK